MKNNWGGVRQESQVIRKIHDQWCRDNGYPIKARDRFCICMLKKIKIKIKTTLEKVSFCTFGLEVLVYMTNVCHLVQIKSVM